MRYFPLQLLATAALFCFFSCGQPQPNGNTWGDTGDGRYRNPVLAADYSDPDAIRVGDKYYMVASDFHFMGMQVLESDDLVNWRLISQIYKRFDLPGWDANVHYAGGSWAPSIRWHDGRFWVFFCTPEEGLFMSSATDPAGPWEPLHCVKAIPSWEDPCPFWDEDGQAYLGHSLKGAGPIILHRMSPDGRELLDEGVTIYRGPTAEGTKIHRYGDWYYLSIPEGGVRGGWQTVLRSKDIYGPYERRVVLETGSTDVNGPHQGAIVDTPSGEWWFLHFQQLDPLGRVVHLQPMRWEDGWPVIGEDYDGNGVGEPVAEWAKPRAGRTAGASVGRGAEVSGTASSGPRGLLAFLHRPSPVFLPASSDDFSAPELGLQWQFNHNPVDSAWSLTSHPGMLALDALPAKGFVKARNTLSQKLMGYVGSYRVRLDMTEISDGQCAGLACMAAQNRLLEVCREDGVRTLSVVEARVPSVKHPDGTDMPVEIVHECIRLTDLPTGSIWLGMSFDARENVFQFAWSADGEQFTSFGSPFAAHFGHWKGARVALYSYQMLNTETTGDAGTALPTGTAIFDDFTYLRQE